MNSETLVKSKEESDGYNIQWVGNYGWGPTSAASKTCIGFGTNYYPAQSNPYKKIPKVTQLLAAPSCMYSYLAGHF